MLSVKIGWNRPNSGSSEIRKKLKRLQMEQMDRQTDKEWPESYSWESLNQASFFNKMYNCITGLI